MYIDNIKHVYWQTRVVFTNVIDNIMNHVYWQTRVVFTYAIDNIMNHVYWQTRAVFTIYEPCLLIIYYEPCLLANRSGIYQCH